MGTNLMADEVDRLSSDMATLSRAVGRLEGVASEIQRHLVGQDERTEFNKNEAIKKRDEKEARDEARFKVLDEKSTSTGGRVALLEKVHDEEVKPVLAWHRDEGSKLGGRVSLLEQKQIADAAEKARAETLKAGEDGEKRGAWRVWALLGSLVTGLIALLGWLGWDALSPMLTRFGEMLARHH
jgi:hypothetical protein